MTSDFLSAESDRKAASDGFYKGVLYAVGKFKERKLVLAPEFPVGGLENCLIIVEAPPPPPLGLKVGAGSLVKGCTFVSADNFDADLHLPSGITEPDTKEGAQ